jgi:serine/threonine protein kinase
MRKHLNREYEVYQRLPHAHDRLIKMIDYSEDSALILEYIPLGSLRKYLESHEAEITHPQRLQWCIDAAEAVELIHSHNIIHCDIKPENFLLDSDLRLRLIDFSGSSIDGKPSHVLESTRFFLPRSWDDPCTVITDLFALGSSIYEIVTGRQPYADLKDEEVEARYKRREFPIVDGMSCGEIIEKCWIGEFNSATAVQVALEVEMQQYNVSIISRLCSIQSIGEPLTF